PNDSTSASSSGLAPGPIENEEGETMAPALSPMPSPPFDSSAAASREAASIAAAMLAMSSGDMVNSPSSRPSRATPTATWPSGADSISSPVVNPGGIRMAVSQDG